MAPCLNYAMYSGYMLPRPLRVVDELLIQCNYVTYIAIDLYTKTVGPTVSVGSSLMLTRLLQGSHSIVTTM